MEFPPISSRVSVPPVVWRGETDRALPDNLSAADVLRHDADTSGRVYDFAPDFWGFLASLPGELLLWVTFTREEAAIYGPPEELPVDVPAAIIATDDAGGYLLLLEYTPPPQTGAATVTGDPLDPAADVRREIKDEIYEESIIGPNTALPEHGYALEIAEGIIAARSGQTSPSDVYGGIHYDFEKALAALPAQAEPRGRLANPFIVQAAILSHPERGEAWGASPVDAAMLRDMSPTGTEAHPADRDPRFAEFNAPEFGPGYLDLTEVMADPWNAVSMPLHRKPSVTAGLWRFS